VARTRADVDLWGHLRFGLDIVQERSLEIADHYSFTSDRPWINHEWLSEIAIALAWQTAGTTGLIFLKLACIVGALALMAAALQDQGVTGRARILSLCPRLNSAGVLDDSGSHGVGESARRMARRRGDRRPSLRWGSVGSPWGRS